MRPNSLVLWRFSRVGQCRLSIMVLSNREEVNTMSINEARQHLARELGITLRKGSITWENHPDGWQRQRHLSLTAKQRRARRARGLPYQTHRTEPMRGKEKCQHREYIKSRTGRILKDPD